MQSRPDSYVISGLYQLSPTAPYTSLHQLSSSSYFLASKEDGGVLYLFRLTKSTLRDNIFSHEDSLHVEITLIDTLEKWLQDEGKRAQAVNLFTGVDVVKLSPQLQRKVMNLSTGEPGRMFIRIHNDLIISIAEDGTALLMKNSTDQIVKRAVEGIDDMVHLKLVREDTNSISLVITCKCGKIAQVAILRGDLSISSVRPLTYSHNIWSPLFTDQHHLYVHTSDDSLELLPLDLPSTFTQSSFTFALPPNTTAIVSHTLS